MQYVGRAIGSVSKTWNSINPATLSGAIDVIVVEQENGELACSPFHIRFGKFSLLRPSQKKVEFKCNGEKKDLPMKLGDGGEAFFVFATEGDVPEDLLTSPVISPSSSPTSTGVSTPLGEPEFLELSKSPPNRARLIGPKDQDAHSDSLVDIGSPKGQNHEHDWSTPNSTRPTSPGLTRQEAYAKVEALNKRLGSNNIVAKVHGNGDVMLDMHGYKPDSEDAVRADELAREILTEQLSTSPSQTDLSSLIAPDNEGNLWVYSSQEAKDKALSRQEKSSSLHQSTNSNSSNEETSSFSPSSPSEDAFKIDPQTAAELSTPARPGTASSAVAAAVELERRHPIPSVRHAVTDVGSDRVGIKHADTVPATGRITPEDSGDEKTQGPEDSGIKQEEEHEKSFVKTLRLTSEQLKSLNLKSGANPVSFSVNQGRAECSARIFYWRWDDYIVISDIDGTITKSDALGQVFTIIGKDWTHIGVAKLFSDIAQNGYKLMYLTSRSVGQADSTRNYLKWIQQGDYKLPDGPVILSPDRTYAAFRREVIYRKPEVFKMACLRDIKSLFGDRVKTPFYAGFGNRITDALSYRSVGVPPSKIFTINSNAEVHMELLELAGFKSSYVSLNDLVDQFFPPVHTQMVESAYTDANYWREPIADLSDLEDDDESEQQDHDDGHDSDRESSGDKHSQDDDEEDDYDYDDDDDDDYDVESVKDTDDSSRDEGK